MCDQFSHLTIIGVFLPVAALCHNGQLLVNIFVVIWLPCCVLVVMQCVCSYGVWV